MNLLNPVLIAIIIFGIATSYTDIKRGKIKNTHLILLLFSGLFINTFFTGTLLDFSYSTDSIFISTIVNAVFAFLFGFFIWIAGLWPSGDAKLFFGYSFLLPVFVYQYGYIYLFPSFVILINTIIPMAFFLIFSGLLQLKWNYFKNYLRKNFTISDLANTALFIFGFSYLLQLVLLYFNIHLNFIFQTVILFILMEALSKVNRWATAVFSLGGAILKLLLSFSSVFALPFLWYMIITLLMFVGLRLVLFCIIEFSFTESVKIKNLKPGMLVEEHLIKTKKGYEKKEYSLFTIFDVLQQTKRGFLSESSTSLTDEDIKKIRELKKERKIKFDTMKIAKTIPFAPFMFFGVMLTYVLQGSLFYYLSLVVGFLVKFFA